MVNETESVSDKKEQAVVLRCSLKQAFLIILQFTEVYRKTTYESLFLIGLQPATLLSNKDRQWVTGVFLFVKIWRNTILQNTLMQLLLDQLLSSEG